MKYTGIVRKLDELGRVTIPKKLRKVLEWEERADIEIYIDDHKILLKKHVQADIFNGNTSELICYHGINVSKESIFGLIKLADLDIVD